MSRPSALLDTDTLSEVIKNQDPDVRDNARAYLREHKHFRFSIITRYQILRGLKAKGASRQLEAFEERCRASEIVPLSDEIVVKAADIYSDLRNRGVLIDDGDILIAATALVHDWLLVSGNRDHFTRIAGLRLESCRKKVRESPKGDCRWTAPTKIGIRGDRRPDPFTSALRSERP